MRFLPHEHAAITAALTAQGVDIRTVLFVKRRGRLHVQVPGRTDSFIFFRKKTTKLDAQGQWKDHTEYHIGQPNAGNVVREWVEVMAAFDAWLSNGGSKQ